MKSSNDGISVRVKFFDELFRDKDRIIIPEYQRSYEWGREKTAILLADLREHFLTKAKSKPYYMGTILFHQDQAAGVHEVIDGQQRLTTLLIIRQELEGSIPEHADLTYNSYISVRSIRETRDFIREQSKNFAELRSAGFLSLLEFTEVITSTEDDAFSFFDTQNNRGVMLGATDFLKAYHLREISSEILQNSCANQWEATGVRWENDDFLAFLFQKILYRSRAWRSKNTPAGSKEELLDVFQKQALDPGSDHGYPLYRGNRNRQALARTFADNGTWSDVAGPEGKDDLTGQPFSLRQPVHKGLQFFHFTEKYAALHTLLFDGNTGGDPALAAVREFYREVYNEDMSVYLRHLFRLAVVMYYDVFETLEIVRFCYHLDYLIGSARIAKSLVRKETAQNCLTGPDLNLLDVIAYAYRPEEVFDFIRKIPGIWTIYQDYKMLEEDVDKDDVRRRYSRRVTTYFRKTLKDFYERKSWLEN